MSSLNMLWRMLAVDLRFGAREVAGRFGAEALQLHRVERPRAQRHRHRGGVREAAGHRGTPLPAKGPRRCKGPATSPTPMAIDDSPALCTACGPWRASERRSTPPLRARPPEHDAPRGSRVAFVFQNVKLFKESVLENVRAARPDATRDQVLAALEPWTEVRLSRPIRPVGGDPWTGSRFSRPVAVALDLLR